MIQSLLCLTCFSADFALIAMGLDNPSLGETVGKRKLWAEERWVLIVANSFVLVISMNDVTMSHEQVYW